MNTLHKRTDLILIGAGGLAYDVIDCVNEINQEKMSWNLLGVLDDTVQDFSYRGVEWIGTSDKAFSQAPDTHFLVCFSSPNHFFLRKPFLEKMQARQDLHFANVIHPTVSLSPTASLGRGLFLSRGVIVGPQARVGNHVIVLFNSVVSRFVGIGDYSFLSANVNITGRCQVGESCYLGVNATINADVGPFVLVSAGGVVKKRVVGPAIVHNDTGPQTTLSFQSVEKLHAVLRSL